MEVSEAFEEDIINRISTNRATAQELLELQVFIKSILNEKNEPKLREIGTNEELKKKYIKLAVFLLHFKPLQDNHGHYEGISASLMRHLRRIVELRDKIVKQLTAWMEYLIRDMFGYIFGLEGKQIDQSFLSNFSTQYGVSEKSLNELRLQYETQLKIKDERIRQLEMDNSVVQSASSDNSGIVLKLEEQLKKMEETLAQNDRAHDLKMIKQKGEFEMTNTKLNIDLKNYQNENEKLKNQISQMEDRHRSELARLQLEISSSKNNNNLNITKDITSKYEIKMSDMKRQLNNVMSQKNDSSNVRESVTI